MDLISAFWKHSFLKRLVRKEKSRKDNETQSREEQKIYHGTLGLLGHTSKIMATILLRRIKEEEEQIGIIPNEECEFREERSTEDQVIRIIQEWKTEEQRGQYSSVQKKADLAKPAYSKNGQTKIWKNHHQKNSLVIYGKNIHHQLKRNLVNGKKKQGRTTSEFSAVTGSIQYISTPVTYQKKDTPIYTQTTPQKWQYHERRIRKQKTGEIGQEMEDRHKC